MLKSTNNSLGSCSGPRRLTDVGRWRSWESSGEKWTQRWTVALLPLVPLLPGGVAIGDETSNLVVGAVSGLEAARRGQIAQTTGTSTTNTHVAFLSQDFRSYVEPVRSLPKDSSYQ